MQVKYAFIVENSTVYSITRLCSVIEVSRRGYYDWLKRPESASALSNRQLLVEILTIKGTQYLIALPLER